MQTIITWTVSLVTVCTIGAIILYFSPTSSVSKSVKTVVILCVIMTFLSPIFKISLDKNNLSEYGSDSDYNDNLTDITDQMLKYAELEAEELCDSFISECGCKAEKIEIKANIDNENSIYISSIKIYMAQAYKDKEKNINEKIRNVFNTDGEFLWLKE